MSMNNIGKVLIPIALIILAISNLFANQSQDDDIITITKPVEDDLYLAAESIHVLSEISGDLVTASRRVDLQKSVSGDLISAAEHVIVQGSVGDDARLAGRVVTITGNIGDDAIVAGESVNLVFGSRVGGRLWVAGSNINVAGQIGGEIRAMAQFISISGQTQGDVFITAEEIEILPGTHIAGNLRYQSPNIASISPGAQIDGTTQHDVIDTPKLDGSAGISAFLGFLVILLFSVSVIYWLFPAFIKPACKIVQHNIFKCIGSGLIFFLVTPLLALLLMFVVLGIPLGLTLLALYFASLFIGFSIGLIVVSNAVLQLLGQPAEGSAIWRMIALLSSVILLAALQFLPVVGGVAVFTLLLAGLGGINLMVYQSYRAR